MQLTTAPTMGPVGQIAGSRESAPSDGGYARYSVTLPFSIGLFTYFDANVCIITSGVMQVGADCNLCGSAGDCGRYDQIGNNVIFPTNLQIQKGTVSGIDYRIDGVSPNRVVTFRWYMFNPANSRSNFSASYYENQPGVVLNTYFALSYDESTNSYLRLEAGVFIDPDDGPDPLGYNNVDKDLMPGATVLYDTNTRKVMVKGGNQNRAFGSS